MALKRRFEELLAGVPGDEAKAQSEFTFAHRPSPAPQTGDRSRATPNRDSRGPSPFAKGDLEFRGLLPNSGVRSFFGNRTTTCGGDVEVASKTNGPALFTSSLAGGDARGGKRGAEREPIEAHFASREQLQRRLTPPLSPSITQETRPSSPRSDLRLASRMNYDCSHDRDHDHKDATQNKAVALTEKGASIPASRRFLRDEPRDGTGDAGSFDVEDPRPEPRVTGNAAPRQVDAVARSRRSHGTDAPEEAECGPAFLSEGSANALLSHQQAYARLAPPATPHPRRPTAVNFRARPPLIDSIEEPAMTWSSRSIDDPAIGHSVDPTSERSAKRNRVSVRERDDAPSSSSRPSTTCRRSVAADADSVDGTSNDKQLEALSIMQGIVLKAHNAALLEADQVRLEKMRYVRLKAEGAVKSSADKVMADWREHRERYTTALSLTRQEQVEISVLRREIRASLEGKLLRRRLGIHPAAT
ncbi:hypothetical protein ACQY0O_005308 [Thecaphora frezii]